MHGVFAGAGAAATHAEEVHKWRDTAVWPGGLLRACKMPVGEVAAVVAWTES